MNQKFSFLCLFSFFMLLFSFNRSAAVELNWAHSTNAQKAASTLDDEGNVYLTGYFTGTLTYNNISVFVAKGTWDAFVLKIKPDGNIIWAQQIGGAGSRAAAADIKVDNAGNIYLTGEYLSTIDFNRKSGVNSLTSVGSWDIFVCKMDSSGNNIWARSMGGAQDDHGAYVEVDKAGNVFMLGYFKETIDLDPGPGIDTFPNIRGGNTYDDCLAKLDPDGNYLWGLSYTRSGNIDRIGALDVDSEGNAYVLGSFFEAITFHPRTGIPSVPAPAQPRDIHILKFNPGGKLAWAKVIGGTGSGDFGYDLVIDDDNNLYISGNYTGVADMDPGPGAENLYTNPKGTSSYYDVFALKLDSAGNFIWTTAMGSRIHDYGHNIAVDKAGNVYLTGSFQDTMDFNYDNMGFNLKPSNGNYDIFVTKLNKFGKYVWSIGLGAEGRDDGHCISVDQSGNVYVSGQYKEEVDFNPDPNISTKLDATTGNATFLMKLMCNDTNSMIIDTALCGAFTFNEIQYDSSGTYMQAFTNEAGCDSTFILNLTIDYITVPEITINGFVLGTVESYDTYQWYFNGDPISGATGSTYIVTANGIYTVEVTNGEGCQRMSGDYEVNNYVGIGRTSAGYKIEIYPNPVSDELFIKAPKGSKFTITGVDGRIILKSTVDKPVNLQHLYSGIYIVHVFDKEGNNLKTEKVIKY